MVKKFNYNLNTTNVSVQSDVNSVATNMSKDLNTTNVSVQFFYGHSKDKLKKKFKYNKCIGSIKKTHTNSPKVTNLNTTNVSVQ